MPRWVFSLSLPDSLVELEDDVLDILADVARLGERGGVGDGEGNGEQARERLRQERLAGPGGTDEQDVRLLQLDVGAGLLGEVDPLVVIVDGDRELLLRDLLSDHVVVEEGFDLLRLRQRRVVLLIQHPVFRDDVETDVDTLVADEDRGPGDELLYFALALVAERAAKRFITCFLLGHLLSNWGS